MPLAQLGADAAAAYMAARTVADVIKTAAGAETWLSRLVTWKRVPRRALAPLYYEILYNMTALWFVQRLRPPTLIVTRVVWTTGQPQSFLGQLFNPAEIGMISSPYLQVDTYDWFFKQQPLFLVLPRFTGDDQRMIERVAQSFRDAEALMRPKIFSKRQRERLSKYLSESGVLSPPKPLTQSARALGAVEPFALPMFGWLAANLLRPYLVRWGVISDNRTSRSA